MKCLYDVLLLVKLPLVVHFIFTRAYQNALLKGMMIQELVLSALQGVGGRRELGDSIPCGLR
jgi:hypothetical protein